jgi:glucose/mannose transport system permease protein
MLAPTIVLLGIFVYGLIGSTVRTSLTDRHSALPAKHFVGLQNYRNLVSNDPGDRFSHAMHNLVVFAVVFIVGTMLIGFIWALLFDRGVRGERFFRTIYLAPIAISFVASGVVWRWLLDGTTGSGAGGLNQALGDVGLGFLENRWWLNPDYGMAAIALPAIWQLAGYVMALFLAGFRGIPGELREAARVDGANTFQLYRHVIFPQLTPAALSALVIVGSVAFKVFDLIMSISGTGYITEVPSVYIWNTQLTSDYAKSCAIAVVLLALVVVVVVPYLIATIRRERKHQQ